MDKDKKSIRDKISNSIKGLTFKSYIEDTVTFVKENLLKKASIMLAIAILILVSLLIIPEQLKMEMTNVTFLTNYIEAIKAIGITVVAGIAPYIYAPLIGFLGVTFNECATMANLILVNGYIKGILMYIMLFILNVIIISFATSLGIHICRNITLGNKISNMKTNSFIEFKISLYEAAKKTNKKKELEKEQNKKIEKMQRMKKELDLFQIINVTVILCILQAIVSLAKSMIV